MHKLAMVFFLFFLLQTVVFAQNRVITGAIKDSGGQAIPYANISLKNNQDVALIYVHSNEQGNYKLEIQDDRNAEELFIEVSYIGFKTVRQVCQKGKDYYDFTLAEEPINLQEIKVRKRPQIVNQKDTLSYAVNAFSHHEDRSIGDVIARLPGISVAENGQISFNGKAIENLLIHGDDLLDGRYGLATKSINKDMIKRIDVITHFQPIQVLKKRVLTNNVALNLVLKDENSLKLAGQVTVGGGLPRQYLGDVALMVFNKKLKFLNAIKANNIGIDLQDDFAQLGNAGMVSATDRPNAKHLLTIGTTGNPDLPKNSFYLNNSQLLNLNNLLNLKSDWQLKSNFQAFIDKNSSYSSNNLVNYLPNDTIYYKEAQTLQNRPNAVIAAINLMTNKESLFFNNRFSFSIDRNTMESNLDFNGNSIYQSLNRKNVNFSNDLNYIPLLKQSKNVLDFRWTINFSKNPQSLFVTPGLNPDIVNQSIPFISSTQNFAAPLFNQNLKASYRIHNNDIIQQNYQVGLYNERQELNSVLYLKQQNQVSSVYNGDFGNQLKWRNDKINANAIYSINREKWRTTLELPLYFQNINYHQADYNLAESYRKTFLNPKISLTLNLNPEDYISINYELNNEFGDITNIYRGNILTNYRTLQANNAPLQAYQVNTVASGYNFKRSIIMLFAAASFSYNRIIANTIASSELANNIQHSILLPYRNVQDSYRVNVDFSKYLLAINTTVSLNTVLSRSYFEQLINQQIYPSTNNSGLLMVKLDTKVSSKVTIGYKATGMKRNSTAKAGGLVAASFKSNSTQLGQILQLRYSPISSLTFNTELRHIFGHQDNISDINYTFIDFASRYKIAKWRTDIEFTISNLTHIKEYEIYNISANQFYESRFALRGRMAMLKATFNL
jgi:hypothetical protein